MSYSKENPYLAAIQERALLTGKESGKETHHIVLSLKGSGIRYAPGDCVAILPLNPPEVVKRTIEALAADPNEQVFNARTKQVMALNEFLSSRANLARINRSLLSHLSQTYTDLEPLLSDKAKLSRFQEDHEVLDLLEDHPGAIKAQELVTCLSPLLPRFYSIASSMNFVGEEMHLTVRYVSYKAPRRSRLGVCTHYLCETLPLGVPNVPLYIQKAHSFKLTDDPDVPIIMIGPGTGVAPYRALLQERKARGAKGRNWLFFGEWTRKGEFFYQSFWEELLQRGRLRLDTAFSRDQPTKVYVQHRMWEQGRDLFAWLEEGAHLYVCGDAKAMAPDVEATLLRVIETHGGLSSEKAREYLKALRKEKRYLKDVY